MFAVSSFCFSASGSMSSSHKRLVVRITGIKSNSLFFFYKLVWPLVKRPRNCKIMSQYSKRCSEMFFFSCAVCCCFCACVGSFTMIVLFLSSPLLSSPLLSSPLLSSPLLSSLSSLQQVTIEHFMIHRIIGRGGFGEVFGCCKSDTGQM